MHNKVFISYCHEDYTFAYNLHNFLTKNEYSPWLDKIELLPGQDWDVEISRALKDADYIILLLSQISVQKRGYVQKEFNLAIEYCIHKLEDDIYLIPLKIDDCDVPRKLLKFQWIDYNNENSFAKILSSLNFQREKYMNAQLIKSAKAVSTDSTIPNSKISYQISKFTSRELEIINLISQGFSSKQIASKLYISTYTVENHRRNIRKKAGVHSMAVLLHNYHK